MFSLSSISLFYWTDIFHELLFVCPFSSAASKLTLNQFLTDDNDSLRKQLANSLHGPGVTGKSVMSQLINNVGCDVKIFIVWLEHMEDFEKLPFRKSSSMS